MKNFFKKKHLPILNIKTILILFLLISNMSISSNILWEKTATSSIDPSLIAFHPSDIDGDGDGDIDIFAGSKLWMENTDGTGTSFSSHEINSESSFPYFIQSIDMDSDGDIDLITYSDLTWWENVESTENKWIQREIQIPFSSSKNNPSNGLRYAVYAIDMDGDRDGDIICAGKELAWLENKGTTITNWVEHTISTDYDSSSSIIGADIDKDGDVDIVTLSHSNDKISWWKNKDGSGDNWEQLDVANSFDSVHSVFIEDIPSEEKIFLQTTLKNYLGVDKNWLNVSNNWKSLEGGIEKGSRQKTNFISGEIKNFTSYWVFNEKYLAEDPYFLTVKLNDDVIISKIFRMSDLNIELNSEVIVNAPEQNIDASSLKLNEINSKIGIFEMKQAGIMKDGTVILKLLNNKPDTIQVTGIKVCDSTESPCFPSISYKHFSLGGTCSTSLLSGQESSIICKTKLWSTDKNIREFVKISLSISYSIGGVTGTTKVNSLALNII